MANVLVIESSARQEGSVSRQLTQAFIEQWKKAHPADSIQVRDLARQPLPHLDMDLLGGWMKPAEQHSAGEQAALARSEQLVAELQAADGLVLAAPMHNCSIPSTRKAWLDHQEPYLRQALGFMGIPDGEFIHAEGLNMGGDAAARGMAVAQQRLAAIA